MAEPKKQTQANWRRFLNSEEGVELINYLTAKRPTIGRGSTEQIILDAGKVEGYRECLSELGNLAVFEKKAENEENQ